MRKKKIIVILLNCFIALLLIVIKPNLAYGVTISIPSYPSTISSEPFTLTASVSGALAGTNYLRIDLFKDLTTDYFGETFNGLDWYNGSTYNQYFPITIISGTPWIGDIQGKIGSTEVENGNYKLKVRRYTSSGSTSSSDPIDININIPTSTPSPTPTPAPTLEITPSPTPTDIITPTISPTLTPTSTSLSYNNIYLSEVMVYPETGEKEWVEIYNDNDFAVSLQNWYIDDIENGGSTPKVFSLDISPKSYAVFNLSSSMFNNNGDSVRLMDFNKNLKDSFEYANSTKGETLARTAFDSDNYCIQEPTKGFMNGNCIVSPTQTPDPTNTPKPTNPPKEKTPTPTKILIISRNIPSKNKTDNAVINDEEVGTELTQVEENPPEVLGFSTKKDSFTSNPKPILQSLAFASFSYSILEIIYIVIKIRKELI